MKFVQIAPVALLLLLFMVMGISGNSDVVDPEPSNDDSSNDNEVKTVTRLTKPLPLRPGEVTNSFHKLPIPDGPIAIYEFAADVVEKDEMGNIVPVPLSDAYLHHHVVFSYHEKKKKHWWNVFSSNDKKKNNNGPQRGIGFGAGTESRGTPQKFYHPYAFMTEEDENEFVANVHIINTRGMNQRDAGHCLECPCTTVDTYEGNGTILQSVSKRRKSWENCNVDLVSEQNTACFADSYYGGLLCCEDGEYCLDEYDVGLTGADNKKDKSKGADSSDSISTYYLRYTLSYRQATEENRPIYLATCCDATGNETVQGNIEYDIQKQDCDDNIDDNNTTCGVHTLNTVQLLHKPNTTSVYARETSLLVHEERYVDVVYMVGHLHRGGIEISAYDHTTGELMCSSKPTYGRGNEIRNEDGYIVAMSTCTFDPPKRMKTTDPIFITSSYDATQSHTGVMSLFYVAISDVEPEGGWDAVPLTSNNDNAEPAGIGFVRILQWVVLLIIVVYAAYVSSQYVVRKVTNSGYELVPSIHKEQGQQSGISV